MNDNALYQHENRIEILQKANEVLIFGVLYLLCSTPAG